MLSICFKIGIALRGIALRREQVNDFLRKSSTREARAVNDFLRKLVTNIVKLDTGGISCETDF